MNDIRFPGYEEYKDSLVAFVDVLGFDKDARNIRSEQEFVDIAALLSAFKDTAACYSQDSLLLKNFEMTTVSDSAIVSMPYDDRVCAMALIIMLHGTQYDLIATPFRRLLRGFLTRGRVYHRNGIIFGEGYSKAYECEQHIGHAPRIVIDPCVIEDAKRKVAAYRGTRKVSHIFNYLRRDPSDGLYFIDYLKPAPEREKPSDDVINKEHQDIDRFIGESLVRYEGDLKTRRKYEWLRWYFSTCCSAT